MRVVVACCLCERVFDDMEQEMERTRWKERNWYLSNYQLKSADIRVVHGYCPDCLKSYRTFLALGQPYHPQKEEKA